MRKTYLFSLLAALTILSSCDKVAPASSGSGTTSNGSLTRFITVGDYLYVVDNFNLKSYNISTPATPVFKSSTNIGFAIQTIFSYQDKLFIGSSANMYIYSITKPESPAKITEVPYFVRGKDPIVANDTAAYSTVQNLAGFSGVLNIYNTKNINQPSFVQSISMQSPFGLAIKDSALYVCDGSNGIKSYSIKNAYNPQMRNSLNLSETAYDLIVQGNILICYIQGGLCFLDISNYFKPVVISTVKN